MTHEQSFSPPAFSASPRPVVQARSKGESAAAGADLLPGAGRGARRLDRAGACLHPVVGRVARATGSHIHGEWAAWSGPAARRRPRSTSRRSTRSAMPSAASSVARSSTRCALRSRMAGMRSACAPEGSPSRSRGRRRQAGQRSPGAHLAERGPARPHVSVGQRYRHGGRGSGVGARRATSTGCKECARP